MDWMNDALKEMVLKLKLGVFPGQVSISDMHDYCKPIIKKKPSYIILHVGTNAANEYSSREILDKLLSIKSFIESELPTCKIIISTPTYRNDNAKCGLTIKHLCDHIVNLNLGIVDNTNVCGVHLGKRGLHMNGKGTGKLAMNIISCMTPNVSAVSKPIRCLESGVSNQTADLRQLDNWIFSNLLFRIIVSLHTNKNPRVLNKVELHEILFHR